MSYLGACAALTYLADPAAPLIGHSCTVPILGRYQPRSGPVLARRCVPMPGRSPGSPGEPDALPVAGTAHRPELTYLKDWHPWQMFQIQRLGAACT